MVSVSSVPLLFFFERGTLQMKTTVGPLLACVVVNGFSAEHQEREREGERERQVQKEKERKKKVGKREEGEIK